MPIRSVLAANHKRACAEAIERRPSAATAGLTRLDASIERASPTAPVAKPKKKRKAKKKSRR